MTSTPRKLLFFVIALLLLVSTQTDQMLAFAHRALMLDVDKVVSEQSTSIAVHEATETALAPQAEALPQGRLPLSEVETVTMPSVDVQALEQEDRQRAALGRPTRFAHSFNVGFTPATIGTWENLDQETSLWRLRIVSPEAVSLNLGFTSYKMPAGGQLLLYSADNNTVVGPFTSADNEEHGQLWSPLLRGDDIVVEVTLPTAQVQELKLELTSVNHGYREFGRAPTSGACNVDVVCSQGDDWRSEIRSVAHYVISDPSGSEGSFVCTGSLINNTSQNMTPYFLTADHCATGWGGDWTTAAATVVVYWNYENSTCRTPGSTESGEAGDGSKDQFQTGTIFRSVYPDTDMALVELDDNPNPSFNVHWAGWDRTGSDATAAVAIHHPNGEEKRISFENQSTTVTSYSETESPGDETHIRITDWDVGTTEGGSSGSPLFDQNHRIIGQLHGGAAACGNDESDWYGRFSVSWDGGGTDATRLSNWLAPDGSDDMVLDGTEAVESLDILQPTTSNPAFAGPPDNPNKIIIKTTKPATGLTTNNFTVTVGSDVASIVTVYEGSGEYAIEVVPPQQSADGEYDLEVSATVGSNMVSDSEQEAVVYGDTNNVDVMLVIDRSGSMSTTEPGSSLSYMEAAKQAATQFVDFMFDGDQVGVASFSSSARVDFGLTELIAGAGGPRQQAKDAIAPLFSSGGTTIGGGLLIGQQELEDKGVDTHPWAMVLLSDGENTSGLRPEDVLPDIVASKTVVHTIALGPSSDQATMLDIASQTGGTYTLAPTADQLGEVYNTIAGTVSGQQSLLALSGIIQQGQTDEKSVVIDSTVSEATFSVQWSNNANSLGLTIEDPNGNMIDAAVANANADMTYVSGPTYRYYRVRMPALVTGVWKMKITGGTISTRAGSNEAEEEYEASVTGQPSGAAVALNTYFFSGTSYPTNTPIKVSATLSDDLPILGADVVAVVGPLLTGSGSRAEDADPILILHDDGLHADGLANDGVYGNTLEGTNTASPGLYSFQIFAVGTATNGDAFSRRTEQDVNIGVAPTSTHLHAEFSLFLPSIIR